MRKLLLVLCLLSIAANVYDGWLCAHFGSTGITFQYSPSGATTISVEPGSAGYRAGLRTGETIDPRALPSAARYRWYENVVAGERFWVPLQSGTGVRIVPVIADRAEVRPLLWFALAGFVWFALFGGLLAWRRGENAEARTLALLLVLFPGLVELQIGYFYTPWVWVDLAADVLGSLTLLSTTLLATYAMLFQLPNMSLRRTLAALAYVAGIAAAAFVIVADIRIWVGLPLPARDQVLSGLYTAGTLFSLLCALVTVRQSTGVERTRLAWVTASLGPFYALVVIQQLLFAIAGIGHWVTPAVDAAAFVAPFGLWVSLLNRRVFDIGFALNRAAVFTGVSVVIVGIFVLMEWAFSEWFSSASHTTNLAISAVLALALGLSVRAIHTRVDRVLDVVFFRKRHEDEQAIRTLAREAAYITDPGVLLSRMVAVLEEHADASSAHVLLDGRGRYDLVMPSEAPALVIPSVVSEANGVEGPTLGPGVSENDPAIVRLCATQKVLDLHDVQSAIPGEFAYPMLARGRLVGVLVLGPKRSGESYAPDESDAIAQLAHDAGAALDVLAMKGHRPSEEGRGELGAVYEIVKRLEQRLDEALNVRTMS